MEIMYKTVFYNSHKRSLIDLEICNAPYKISNRADKLTKQNCSLNSKSRVTVCKLVCFKQYQVGEGTVLLFH